MDRRQQFVDPATNFYISIPQREHIKMHHSACGADETRYNKEDAVSHNVGWLAAVRRRLASPVLTTNRGLQAAGEESHTDPQITVSPRLLDQLG